MVNLWAPGLGIITKREAKVLRPMGLAQSHQPKSGRGNLILGPRSRDLKKSVLYLQYELQALFCT